MMIQNMTKFHIKIKNQVVYKTNDKKKALQIISKIFRDGHEDIYLHGGRMGKWWNR